MSQFDRVNLSNKILEKTLKQSLKKAIAAKGINTTTRRGNKELKFLLTKIAQYPFANLQQARSVGEKLGELIAEIFAQKSKEHLDSEIIYQLSRQSDLLALAGLSDRSFYQVSEDASPEKNFAKIDVFQGSKETTTLNGKKDTAEPILETLASEEADALTVEDSSDTSEEIDETLASEEADALTVEDSSDTSEEIDETLASEEADALTVEDSSDTSEEIDETLASEEADFLSADNNSDTAQPIAKL